MKKSTNNTIIIFFLFILLNAFRLAFITQLLTSLPWDYFLGKMVSAIAICGIFITLLFVIKKRIFLIIFYILQTIFLFSNLAYFFYFHNYLHLFSWFSLLKETTSIIKHLAIPLEWEMLWLLIDIPFFVLTIINYSKIRQTLKINKIKIGFKLKISLVLFLIIFFIFAYFVQFIIYYKDSTPYELLNTNKFKGEATFIYFYGFTANSIAVFYRDKYNNKKEELLSYGPLISINNEDNKFPKNHVFIFQIEAFESSAVLAKYNNEYVMPFLNELKNSSIFFPFCLSYHKGGNTSDAEFSVINSVEPLNDYPAIKLGSNAFSNSFIKILKNFGYDTHVFHGNAGYFFDRQSAFPKAGFNIFHDLNSMKLKQVTWGASDEDVYNYMLENLKNQKEPFIYYIISMSSHEPYNLINPVFFDKTFEQIDDIRTKNYFNSMRYVDKTLQYSVQKILIKFPDAVIIIFGDHSSAIRNSKYYKNSRVVTPSGNSLEFVPLFIISKDLSSHFEKQKAVSFLDIAPTILSLSNVNATIKTYGENLIDFTNLKNKIYFKGESFSRKELFNIIFDSLKDYFK